MIKLEDLKKGCFIKGLDSNSTVKTIAVEFVSEKFGLTFEIFTREKMETSSTGNFFIEHDLIIAKLDQLARAEDL
ncbi:hypothetical protein DSCO28_48040 [Desulfosarcina ovata subsp. sediminis]|uniref:Uncharacterized protein n=1 Tax=Desulfosarcina ovata subsp. sediminis TaxID=885957 RepID=A0A5K7ZVL5_9BACT|nr:hypothetical protein [Desulfosarcina ovata]BBO84238.1 hypothetical protein DSCO28_48040 [Desulfosarcina ovata subsp. sediminis]